MPIYKIRCDSCGHDDEIVRPVARYDDLPDHCGTRMHRVICAPMVANDISPYKSMVTGEMIMSRSQHRNHLKQHNVIEVGNEKLGPKKYEADHNVRPEMMQAIRQTLGK